MKKKIILLLIICFTMLIKNVDAASSFSASSSGTNLTKGGKATLTISGKNLAGKFSISSSNSSVVSIGTNYVWIDNSTEKITLSALSVGKSTITITPADVASYDGSGFGGAKTITINVSLPREKSNNNFLKSLSVNGFELVPVFDKNTLEYNVSVPSTTNSVIIDAVKENNYASITGTGEFEVVDGVNSFEVTCTSETGTPKVYLVTVTVEDLNPIEVKVGKETLTVVKNAKNLVMPVNFVESSVSINGITIPAFTNETSKLTLVGLKDSNNVMGLYKYDNEKYEKYIEIISGKIQFSNSVIATPLKGYVFKDIVINESSVKAMVVQKNSEFAILYGMDIATGKEGYYRYDLKTESIQRYDSELIDTLKEQNKNYVYVLIGLGSLTFLTLLLVIILGSSNHKKNKLIKKVLSKYENQIPKSVDENEIKEESEELEEKKEEPKSKKELKEEKKQAKIAKKNEKKQAKVNDSVEQSEEESSELSKMIDEIIDESEETYDLFDDDKKKNKKKK